MKKLIKLSFLIYFFTIGYSELLSQSYFTDALTPDFHKNRRVELRKMMPQNSVAVFFNNPIRNRSNDTDYEYRPNSDFFYLTGFREPNSALIVFKDPVMVEGISVDEVLFVQKKDARKEQWEGEILGVQGAKDQLNFSTVFLNSDFPGIKGLDFSTFSQVLAFQNLTSDLARSNSSLNEMIQKFQNSASTNRPSDLMLNQIMNKMRGVKTPEEIALLRKAIEISAKGHEEAIKSIQPGVSERAIQGVHEFVHKVNDAEYVGYGSIVGSGNNTTILHYVSNHVTDLKDGLMLMDVGAEYRGYSGDITRTVPVKGKFSKEEKEIYEIVLEAMEESIKACKPGATMDDVMKASQQVINKGLAKLGIIKKGESHPYFPHGIGHHLGLDVHDRGAYGKLEPGMVITVEPGIYIPEGSKCDPKWWKIGVRIEDNILITENGHENLNSNLAKKVSDIEALMKKQGILQRMDLKK
jgi:Xaa-Pro aminopeptidase